MDDIDTFEGEDDKVKFRTWILKIRNLMPELSSADMGCLIRAKIGASPSEILDQEQPDQSR